MTGALNAATPLQLAPAIAAAVWRASELGGVAAPTRSSGWALLDAELPGCGWPTRSLVEILQPQATVAEWRLLGPALATMTQMGRPVVVIGPPKHPHLPGLAPLGLDPRLFVWIQVAAPAERLWVVEQLVKANAGGAIVAWLPQARQEQIRRLQIAAQSSDGLIFLCRPSSVADEPSAAPLRVELRHGTNWQLRVRVLKRRGSALDAELLLSAVPVGLEVLMTPRLARPSALLPAALPLASVEQDAIPDALGRTATRPPRRHERALAH